MKKVLFILLLAAGSKTGFAQEDTLIIQRDSIPAQNDTIRVGGIIIIKKPGDYTSHGYKAEKYFPRRHYKKDNIETNWLIMDIGFSGYNDRTNYANPEAQDFLRFQNGVPASKGDYALRGSRISNWNLWFFMQKVNMYKHVVNLKYGFGLETNSYFYKTPITYVDGPHPYTFRDSIQFDKNKIAADFLTVPFMLNFNTNPYGKHGGFQISIGVSGGYLVGARQKQKSDQRGKQKIKTDYNLSNWKAAWVAELGLGPVKLYGSYAMTELHEYGLEQYPFTVGVRLSVE